jgi:hypothetical protein
MPGLPHIAHPLAPELGLFCVGISPRNQTSRQTVRRRVLRQHIGGNVGSSTFRYVLAALLLETLQLNPTLSGSDKPQLNKDENRRLRDWQQEHMRLTWVARSRPWEVEADVILQMRPPLNSATNVAHPFYPRARAARAAFRAAARRR